MPSCQRRPSKSRRQRIHAYSGAAGTQVTSFTGTKVESRRQRIHAYTDFTDERGRGRGRSLPFFSCTPASAVWTNVSINAQSSATEKSGARILGDICVNMCTFVPVKQKKEYQGCELRGKQLLRRQYLYFCTSKASKLSGKLST